jgi:TonB family protein
MLNAGHVRLGAALVAALGMHALLFVYSDTPVIVSDGKRIGGSLEVILESTVQSANTKSNDQLFSKNEREHIPSKAESQKEVNQAPEAATPEETSYSASSSSVSLPTEIQNMILAQVAYPSQARRRGWEGEAEFAFSVNNKSVHRVTMLASTGYPILDRAAQHGLLSVRSLPLMDGSYRLPVVFRLQ